MMRTSVLFCALQPFVAWAAQGGEVGFDIPLTITGGGLYTHRLQSNDSQASPAAAAFRTVWYPTLKLGSRWYASASIQVDSSPFFYFEADKSERKIEARVVQGYVGYTTSREKNSLTVKVGKLVSAFGSFPLRYDDELNSLIDVPPGYGSSEYGALKYPVTLYGQPGVEVDMNLRRWDARIQFVNSSPGNPRALFAGGQNPNWVAGSGYTIRQGFRVGGSFYRGGYLTVGRLLLATENAGDWPATGVGLEAQWARGPWSVNGEWQRFYFPYGRIIADTTLKFGYAEVKRLLPPRLYVATRFGYNTNNSIQRAGPPRTVPFRPNRTPLELTLGFRLNRSQLLKLGYEWARREGSSGSRDDVLGVQFVTSLQGLSKVFHRDPNAPGHRP
jgi:hypothetical protein